MKCVSTYDLDFFGEDCTLMNTLTGHQGQIVNSFSSNFPNEEAQWQIVKGYRRLDWLFLKRNTFVYMIEYEG